MRKKQDSLGNGNLQGLGCGSNFYWYYAMPFGRDGIVFAIDHIGFFKHVRDIGTLSSSLDKMCIFLSHCWCLVFEKQMSLKI